MFRHVKTEVCTSRKARYEETEDRLVHPWTQVMESLVYTSYVLLSGRQIVSDEESEGRDPFTPSFFFFRR